MTLKVLGHIADRLCMDPTYAYITSLFTDEFGSWRVVADKVYDDEYAPDPTIVVVGRVLFLHEGDWVRAGSFARGVGASEIDHTSLRMRPDVRGMSMQGLGFARQWIDRCIDRYRAAGYELVTITASEDGAYIWPRFGFRTELCEDYFQIVDDIANRVRSRGVESDMAERWEAIYAERRNGVAVHENIVDLANMADADGYFLMEGLIWRGILPIKQDLAQAA